MVMDAFERWRLKDFAPGEGVALRAFADETEDLDWVDVSVPGDVHRALIASGRIPDPFYDRNELECGWIETREWWYRTRFECQPRPVREAERVLLVFRGLDTFARVWLNGKFVGAHANMFRQAVFDVTPLVRMGRNNALAVCFDPPLRSVRGMAKPPWRAGSDEADRSAMRKAQFGFGWDWGPRLPTIGIWRPVELRWERQASLRGIHFRTRWIGGDGKQALVSVRLEVERFGHDRPIEAVISLSRPEGSPAAAAQAIVFNTGGRSLDAEASFEFDQPALWWPHGLGEPALHTLEVELRQDGVTLERRKLDVGVRTLTLDQSPDPDEPGARFFRFVVNGVPLFARGANWIPADSFIGGIGNDRYERLLTAARDADMNMLRVWGGGIYEQDAFYDLCDRLGLLVWQDFMFACAPYPEDDPGFVEEVRLEARDQVERLRNHPCLALWCGNNENQWLHSLFTRDQDPPVPLPGRLYYDDILPGIVQEADGSTPYWPGSPWGGPQPNSMLEGDVHDWHVWHGLPVEAPAGAASQAQPAWNPGSEDVAFTHYAEDMGRFISEFGMHASPVLETLRRCLPSDQLYHHSPGMDHHNKDKPKNKGDRLMASVTGLPRDLQEYIDFSMLAQAEGLKFGIEHFRRRKPHCSGALVWQLNDCWPVLSWSLVDYYGFGKAGYYYVKRAYAPVLASFKALDGGGAELWITNDTLYEFRESVTIRSGAFGGDLDWEERIPVRVAANASEAVWSGEAGRLVPGADRYLAVRSESAQFPGNRHFFVALKDLQRRAAAPVITVTPRKDEELAVQVRARAYLFYFHIDVPEGRARFSDNYFDLLPGERRTVSVVIPGTRLTPDMLSFHWR